MNCNDFKFVFCLSAQSTDDLDDFAINRHYLVDLLFSSMIYCAENEVHTETACVFTRGFLYVKSVVW